MYSAGLAEALPISTHAPAGGATRYPPHIGRRERISTHAPAGGATFYTAVMRGEIKISTHAPAGGATSSPASSPETATFLLTPLREGRPGAAVLREGAWTHFYSRPCGRGDLNGRVQHHAGARHFYSRPCGRGDVCHQPFSPLAKANFYSRPCGRDDMNCFRSRIRTEQKFLLTPLREGRRSINYDWGQETKKISTHAPAGGATPSREYEILRNTGFLLTPLREGRQEYTRQLLLAG